MPEQPTPTPAADRENPVLMVLGGIAMAIGWVIAEIFSFILDLLGFWAIVALHVAIFVGAAMIDPTFGTVVGFVMVGGWLLFGVLNILAAIFGDSIMKRIQAKHASEG